MGFGSKSLSIFYRLKDQAKTGFIALLVPLTLVLVLTGFSTTQATDQPPLLQTDPRADLKTTASPFKGNGMWIWQIQRSSGGDLEKIAAKATSASIDTLFIKAAHGAQTWPQFSTKLITTLKGHGLNVCAYQRIIGQRPHSEAMRAAEAVHKGADCLVIDAEAEYEGKYRQARVYIKTLRSQIGSQYPVGLTSFPYVHYHPRFPYSVFLGPGGAQFNLPQMYWRAIGTSVADIYAQTYRYNLPYGRPILPLGGLWQHPSSREISQFRQLATVYGATGISWWSWQSSNSNDWQAIGKTLPLPSAVRKLKKPKYPVLVRGARGDLVLWAQQQLSISNQKVLKNGLFDFRMEQAIRAFQTANNIARTGKLDNRTWPVLLDKNLH